MLSPLSLPFEGRLKNKVYKNKSKQKISQKNNKQKDTVMSQSSSCRLVFSRLALALSLTTVLATTFAISQPVLAQQATSYTYDANGNVLTEDGPRTDVADVMTYTYDANGNRTSITNALGHQIQLLDYNGRGQAQRIIDANNVETQLSYHVRGWLTSVTVVDPSGVANSVTQYDYDNVGQLIQITLPNGVTLNYTYDGARRLTQISNSLGESISYTLDNAGNRTQEQITDNGGGIRYTMTRAYDELSRVMNIIGAEGQTTHLDYDVNSNNTAVTDPRTNTTDQVYDPLDRLTQTQDPEGGTTQFGYDAQDRLTSVTDANGNTTTYTYDAFDNLIQVDSPDTGTSTYTYDNANNRISMTDNRGVVVNYTYDALNRLSSVTYPSSPEENVSYMYDDAVSGNYGIGRLTQITDQSGSTHYHYDHRGNLISKSTTIEAVAYLTTYTYDLSNNPTSILYPSGLEVHYTYDSQGRVQNVTTQQPGEIPQALVSGTTYLPFGPATSMDYGNGLSNTMVYDQDYRLISLNTGTVVDMSYSYDPSGNIIQIDHLNQPANDQGFSYDSLDRLLNSSGEYGLLDYTYDPVGNRLSRSQAQGADTQNEAYNYLFGSNQLSDIDKSVNGNNSQRSFNYDNNGNPISIDDNATPGTDLVSVYNAANRLAQITTTPTEGGSAGNAGSSYQYNALGQRVSKVATLPAQTYTLTTEEGVFSEPTHTPVAGATWEALASALYGTEAVADQLASTLTALGFDLANPTEIDLASLPGSYTVTEVPPPESTDHLLNTGAFLDTVANPTTVDLIPGRLETGGAGIAGEVTYRNLNGITLNADGSLTRSIPDGYDGLFDTNETLAANTDGWIEFTVNATTQGDTAFGFATDSASGAAMPYRIWLEGGLVGVYEGFAGIAYSILPYQVGDVIRIERNGSVVTYLHNGSVFYTSSQTSTEELRLEGNFYSQNSGISGIAASFGASGIIAYYTVQAGDDWTSISDYVYDTDTGIDASDELESALGSPILTAGEILTGFPASLIDDEATMTVASYYPVPASPSWPILATSLYSDATLAAELQAAMGDPELVAGASILETAFPNPLTVVTPPSSTDHTLNPSVFTRTELSPTEWQLITDNLQGGGGAGDVTYRTLNNIVVNSDGSLSRNTPDNYDGNFDTNETLAANTDGWIEFAINTTTQDDTGFGFATDSASGASMPFRIWLEGGLVGVYEGPGWVTYAALPYQVGDTVRVTRTGTVVSYQHNGVTFYTSMQTSTEELRLEGSIYAQNSGIGSVAASFGAVGGPLSYTVQANDDWDSISTALYAEGTADELEAALNNPSLSAGLVLTGFPASLIDDEATVPVDPYYLVGADNSWSRLATDLYNDASLASELESALGTSVNPGQQLLETALPNPLTVVETPEPISTNYAVVETAFSPAAYTVPSASTWSDLANNLYGSTGVASALEAALTAAGYNLGVPEIIQADLPSTLSGGGTDTVIYVYNEAGQLLGEYTEQGNVIVEYVWINGQPLAQVRGINTYTYHNDHLGTPRALTDENGAVVWAANYTPFGEASLTVAAVENNLRFPGQYFDSETQLHYNWFRYYDPSLGRYLESDRLGLIDGPNTYVYVRNNPLKYIDPTGEALVLPLVIPFLGGATVTGTHVAGGAAIAGAAMMTGSAANPAPYSHEDEDEALDLSPDPFGGNCPDMRRAIELLKAQIKWRKSDLNPRSASYQGHLKRIKILEDQLRKLRKAYKDICGDDCP